MIDKELYEKGIRCRGMCFHCNDTSICYQAKQISKEEQIASNKIGRIKFINGKYYTDYEGKIYNGSTGSVYIEDFINILKLDVDFIEYHPDLIYWDNGATINVQDLLPYNFDNFKNIPSWTYSKDKNKQLIPQLDTNELSEFSKINSSGKYTNKY